MRFRKNPVEFEAVQWTDDNLEEMQAFCGNYESIAYDLQADVFGRIGVHLIGREYPEATAELWVEANHSWLPIHVGEWVVKDKLGYYPCKDEIMKVNNTPVDEECTREAPTFGQEIVELLNKHSMERYSGTPDWILGNFLEMVLRQFDCAVQMRANWRGESTELPALQTAEVTSLELPESKKVPLVIYTDGRRNEIGEAEVKQWPGEIHVEGTITGVIPMFGRHTI